MDSAPAIDEDTSEEVDVYLTALAEEARTSFFGFCLLMSPFTGLKIGKLHQYLIGVVQGTVDGTDNGRQAVSVPPQHGKSTILSRYAPAWLAGLKPDVHIAVTAFDHRLACDFLGDARNLIDHPAYKLAFPSISLQRDANRQDYIELSNGSSIRAKSTGKKLTGRTVDWLIIDDPHAGRAEAESPVQRQVAERWYFADCHSRLRPTEDWPSAVVFLIGTRFHPEDLIGKLTGRDYIEQQRLEGIDTEVFQYHKIPALCVDPFHDPVGRTEEGQSLVPELHRDREYLRAVRAAIPRYEWDSQYMCEPRAAASGQADVSRIHRITAAELPEDVEYVRGWDWAVTDKTHSDWSAGALLAYNKEREEVYIVDMWRKKLPWPKLEQQIVELAKQERSSNIGDRYTRMAAEAVAGMIGMFDSLREKLRGIVKLEKRNPPRGGKMLRAQQWFVPIEAGKVYMVKGAWNRDFIDELETFPQGKHDDQIDAVSVAFEALTKQEKVLYF